MLAGRSTNASSSQTSLYSRRCTSQATQACLGPVNMDRAGAKKQEAVQNCKTSPAQATPSQACLGPVNMGTAGAKKQEAVCHCKTSPSTSTLSQTCSWLPDMVLLRSASQATTPHRQPLLAASPLFQPGRRLADMVHDCPGPERAACTAGAQGPDFSRTTEAPRT